MHNIRRCCGIKWAGWVEIEDIKMNWNRNQIESWPDLIYFGSNGLKIWLSHDLPLLTTLNLNNFNIFIFNFYNHNFEFQLNKFKKIT